MTAPPELSTRDLSGVYVMNKNLSDDSDEILRLQGISWWMRKVIANITLTLYVKHYKDEGGVEHINIRQIGTGGFEGNTEDRTLDWTERATEDPVFGPVVSKSRRVSVDNVENDWQRDGWLPDTYEDGAIEAFSKSDTEKSGKTWAADQMWGFAITEGERMHTRKVYFTGPEKQIIRARFVYDYKGPNDQAK